MRGNDDPIGAFSCCPLYASDLTCRPNCKHRIAMHLFWNDKRLFGFLK